MVPRAQLLVRLALAFLLVSSAFEAGAQPGALPELTSPDGRFGARKLEKKPGDIHYQVFEKATNRILFTTTAQFETANDVKAGEFSRDSKLFAAYYHYSKPDYTWVGVWSTETGSRAYTKRLTGWVTTDATIFASGGR